MPDVAIAAELVRVSLRLGDRLVLDDISCTLPGGALTALVGPNGCGKSTLARMMAGYLFPTLGTVRVVGQTLGEVNVHDLRRSVKLVQPATVHEPDPRLTVREVILTGAFGTIDLHDEPSDEDRARAGELIAQLRLAAVADGSFRTCSSGERMRTQIARALMTRPALLLLDEPTSGLDLPMREQLLATLDVIVASPLPPAIVLVTHHLEEIPVSTRYAVLMSPGRIHKTGEPAAVFSSKAMSEAFSFPIGVFQRQGRFIAHTVKPSSLA